MQIAQGKDKAEAIAALKKLFKIKKPILVTPTGEVRVDGVTDDPKPPRPGGPTPPGLQPPLAPPPAKAKEPGSQIGAEKPTEGESVNEARGQEAKDKAIAAKLRTILDKLDKVQDEWAKLERKVREVTDAGWRASADARKEHGVETFAMLPADVQASVRKIQDQWQGARAEADQYWAQRAEPLVAEFGELMQTASATLYDPKWSSIYSMYGGLSDPYTKIDTKRVREDLRSLHLKAATREFYDAVVRNRPKVALGTLNVGDTFAITKAPYGTDIEAGYYRVESKTPKGTQLKVVNVETGKSVTLRSKIEVLSLSAAELARGVKLHKAYKAATEESTEEAPCLPLLEAADRLSKLKSMRERNEALERATLYARFQRLVNMSPAQLREHVRGPELERVLETTRRHKAESIRLGREASEHVLRLKRTPVDSWTPELWEWCKRTVAFIERTRRNGAALLEGDTPTRKLLALRAWGHDPLRESVVEADEFTTLHNFDPALAVRIVDATATDGPAQIRESTAESAPKFKVLKANRKALTTEERAKCLRSKAVWHHGQDGAPVPAVWRAEVDGKTYYVTNTHRAYNVAPTLEGAIGRYHKFIKSTA